MVRAYYFSAFIRAAQSDVFNLSFAYITPLQWGKNYWVNIWEVVKATSSKGRRIAFNSNATQSSMRNYMSPLIYYYSYIALLKRLRTPKVVMIYHQHAKSLKFHRNCNFRPGYQSPLRLRIVRWTPAFFSVFCWSPYRRTGYYSSNLFG